MGETPPIGRSAAALTWSDDGLEFPEFGPIIVTKEFGVGGS